MKGFAETAIQMRVDRCKADHMEVGEVYVEFGFGLVRQVEVDPILGLVHKLCGDLKCQSRVRQWVAARAGFSD